MGKKFEFDALIKKHETLDAAYIDFPFNVGKEFGKRGQVKVQATFDGFAYRGSLTKMGADCHWLGLTKEIRKAIGKNPGDLVHVIIVEDVEPRVVELPDDLSQLLDQQPEVKTFFLSLSFTHQKEYVRWITEAKRAPTRETRLQKTITMLRDKVKHP